MMPSARSLPLFTCGTVEVGLENISATWPPSRSLIAGPAPLYGTCTRSVFVVSLNSSPTMCGPAEVEAKVSLPGSALRTGRQLLQVLRRHGRMRHRDERHLRGARHRGEVLQGVVAGVLVQVRVDHQRALVRERDRVAVGRGLRPGGGADVALRAGAVVDDHLLAPRLAQLRRQDARQRVGAAARRERHDEAHRLVGKLLRDAGRGRSDREETFISSCSPPARRP